MRTRTTTDALAEAVRTFAGVYDAMTLDDADARRGRVFTVKIDGKTYRIQVELNR